MFEKLRRQVKLSAELKTLVHTMKGMAAIGIAAAEQAAESARLYQAVVEDGLGVVLRERGWQSNRDQSPQTLAIVVGTDIGMCGAFNRNVAEFAATALADRNVSRLIAVGHRVVAHLKAVHLAPHSILVAPSDVESLSTSAHELLAELQREDFGEAVMICQHTRHPVAVAARQVSLWPLSPTRLKALENRPWISRAWPAPWPPGAAAEVFEALLRQLLFATLYGVLSASLSAELTARMMAMEAAEKAVEDRRTALIAALGRARQARITDELLDVISGFEVLQTDLPPEAIT